MELKKRRIRYAATWTPACEPEQFQCAASYSLSLLPSSGLRSDGECSRTVSLDCREPMEPYYDRMVVDRVGTTDQCGICNSGQGGTGWACDMDPDCMRAAERCTYESPLCLGSPAGTVRVTTNTVAGADTCMQVIRPTCHFR
ncbi:MAG: hypothetical protein HY698_10315 [Deltaproteobacteria bacterium]|nr:hypothetical protein [Deltaproteobacteria bacterium]